MRAGWGRAVAAMLALPPAVACSGVEVTQIGPKRVSRADDCNVEVFFSSPPSFPVMDIASGRATCQVLSGRTACMEELRKAACRAGAHAMYGFSEAVRADYNYVSATFGVHDAIVTHRPIRDTPAKAPTSPAPASPAPAGDGPACDPICSPGFACREGQCLPQCNPPCEAGEICSRKRICEPTAQGAQLPSPVPPPPTSAKMGRPPNAPPPAANPELAPSWPPSGPPPPPSEPQVVKRRGRDLRSPLPPAQFPGE